MKNEVDNIDDSIDDSIDDECIKSYGLINFNEGVVEFEDILELYVIIKALFIIKSLWHYSLGIWNQALLLLIEFENMNFRLLMRGEEVIYDRKEN